MEWHSNVGDAKYRQYKETLDRVNNKGEDKKEDEEKNIIGYRLLKQFFNKTWSTNEVELPGGVLSHKKQSREFKTFHKNLKLRDSI